jgi:hypothetical protein
VYVAAETQLLTVTRCQPQASGAKLSAVVASATIRCVARRSATRDSGGANIALCTAALYWRCAQGWLRARHCALGQLPCHVVHWAGCVATVHCRTGQCPAARQCALDRLHCQCDRGPPVCHVPYPRPHCLAVTAIHSSKSPIHNCSCVPGCPASHTSGEHVASIWRASDKRGVPWLPPRSSHREDNDVGRHPEEGPGPFSPPARARGEPDACCTVCYCRPVPVASDTTLLWPQGHRPVVPVPSTDAGEDVLTAHDVVSVALLNLAACFGLWSCFQCCCEVSSIPLSTPLETVYLYAACQACGDECCLQAS